MFYLVSISLCLSRVSLFPLYFLLSAFFLPLSSTSSHLLLSISVISSELMSMVNMSSSSEYSPLSSLLTLSARAFLRLFLLFFVVSPAHPVEPRVCIGGPELFPIREELIMMAPSDKMGEVAR